jgi:spore coat polysaccharide biosynthesis predicted glycosyltransferase SpsG
MKKKILFLTDVNKKIGIGHIMRSIRTAKKIDRIKNKLLLILKSKNKINSGKLFDKIYYINNFKNIYNLILIINPDLLIIDLPQHNLKFEKKIYLKNINFLVHDRFLRKKIYSNYLINLNPEIKKKDYKKKLIKNTKLLLGPEYFPINSPKYKKKISLKIKKVLIFLGGGENKLRLIKKIFDIIHKSKINKCDIFFISMDKIDILVKKKLKFMFNLNLYFISNVKNIYKLIRQTDLSIITSGSIAFESCFFNVPMILISVAEDQVEMAKSWSKFKVGHYIGKSNNKNFELNLNGAIKNLFSFKKRFAMSQKQKKFFKLRKNYTSNFIN